MCGLPSLPLSHEWQSQLEHHELRALLLHPSRQDEPDIPADRTAQTADRVDRQVGVRPPCRSSRSWSLSVLFTRITARILALCACINLNQRLGLPARELVANAD
jgi:hypothetical protein